MQRRYFWDLKRAFLGEKFIPLAAKKLIVTTMLAATILGAAKTAIEGMPTQKPSKAF